MLPLCPPGFLLNVVSCRQEDDGDGDAALKGPQAAGGLMVHPVAERLDTLMGVLLAFIKDVSHVNGERRF